jgi:hypothetical protein
MELLEQLKMKQFVLTERGIKSKLIVTAEKATLSWDDTPTEVLNAITIYFNGNLGAWVATLPNSTVVEIPIDDYSDLCLSLYLLESSQESWLWTEEEEIAHRMANRWRTRVVPDPDDWDEVQE